MNGGYVMIKSSDSEIYSKVKKAIEIGKPILYYENDTTCYYIDSASIVGTDVILIKGGKTITIDSSNNVVSSGDIQNHLYNYEITFTYNGNNNILYILTNKIITKCDTWDEFIKLANIGDKVYGQSGLSVITDKDDTFISIDNGDFEPDEDYTTFPSGNLKLINQLF